jgi:DNA-binding response OmpR family regulator
MARLLLIENQTRLGAFMGMSLMDDGHEVAKVQTPEEVAGRLSDSTPDLLIFNTGLPAREKSEFIAAWRRFYQRSRSWRFRRIH